VGAKSALSFDPAHLSTLEKSADMPLKHCKPTDPPAHPSYWINHPELLTPFDEYGPHEEPLEDKAKRLVEEYEEIQPIHPNDELTDEIKGQINCLQNQEEWDNVSNEFLRRLIENIETVLSYNRLNNSYRDYSRCMNGKNEHFEDDF
jgi:hypothetical protein